MKALFVLLGLLSLSSISGASVADDLTSRENLAKELAVHLTSSIDDRCDNRECNEMCIMDACGFDSNCALSNPETLFGQSATLDYGVARIGDIKSGSLSAADKEIMCATINIQAKFKSEFTIWNSTLPWQGFGTSTGVQYNFPAREWECATSQHDNRIRQWYVAGSTGGKNIIFVIDASKANSAAELTRAKNMVNAIINHMSYSDCIQVAVLDSSIS